MSDDEGYLFGPDDEQFLSDVGKSNDFYGQLENPIQKRGYSIAHDFRDPDGFDAGPSLQDQIEERVNYPERENNGRELFPFTPYFHRGMVEHGRELDFLGQLKNPIQKDGYSIAHDFRERDDDGFDAGPSLQDRIDERTSYPVTNERGPVPVQDQTDEVVSYPERRNFTVVDMPSDVGSRAEVPAQDRTIERVRRPPSIAAPATAEAPSRPSVAPSAPATSEGRQGVMSRIMGPGTQSNGRPVIEDGKINWGDPQNPADFFRADAAMREMQSGKTTEGAVFGPRKPTAADMGRAMSYARVSDESVGEDAVERVLRGIRSAESGNNPNARNRNSSAGGLYQFTDGTWGSVLRRMDPEAYGKYNDQQLKQLKTNKDIQEAAARFHMKTDVIPELTRNGIEPTAGNLYLAWFQGPKGAVRAYNAPADAIVARVFPETVEANFNMKFNGKPYAAWTMNDLRAFTAQRMARHMRAEGGRLLQDEFPTHYLPHVGRQVMNGGGDASLEDIALSKLEPFELDVPVDMKKGVELTRKDVMDILNRRSSGDERDPHMPSGRENINAEELERLQAMRAAGAKAPNVAPFGAEFGGGSEVRGRVVQAGPYIDVGGGITMPIKDYLLMLDASAGKVPGTSMRPNTSVRAGLRKTFNDGGPAEENALRLAREVVIDPMGNVAMPGSDAQEPAVRHPREDLEARMSPGQHALLSQMGVMLPNKAADIKEDDLGAYPVDAEGNRLKWLNRPFLSFASKDEGETRYGLPYVLDILTAGTGGGGIAAPVKGSDGVILGAGPVLRKGAPVATEAAAAKAASAAPNAAENAVNIARQEVSRMPSDASVTGSMNPLDNVPFTYKGKNPSEWTPDEFAEVGKKFGVENLGPSSKPQMFTDVDGREFNVPGGLDNKFTYYDLLELKKQGIDPSKIDRDLHTKIQQKILRTMTPENVSDEQVWSGLVFGMTSPNNPLFPNQLAQSRLRLRDPKMIDDLSEMISWQPGETVSQEVRKAANDQIAHRFGLDAASKGGLGVRGSADYTRVAELAKMFKERPDFFRKKPDEPWDNFVERVSSQTAGLSMKTGSFGSVWQDPATAAISAIDRHMAQQFEKTGGLFKDEAQRLAWEERVVKRWNDAHPDNAVNSFLDLRRQSGSEGHIGGMLLEYVGDAKTPKFRLAPKRGSNSGEGEINPALPEHLQEADWVYEPEKVFKMGDAYKRALAINDRIAQEHGLGLFGSQWMEWDRIRRRLEPHENMFPNLEKIPAMSVDQLRKVDAEHRASGHKNYTKVDQQGRKLKDLPEDEMPEGVFLQPTRPRPEAAPFAYFSNVPSSQIVEGLKDREGEE